jgi:L-lactate dehydrogenase complex protein LldG
MNDTNYSRDAILENIRSISRPEKVKHPLIPAFTKKTGSLRADFEFHLEKAAGKAFDVSSPSEAANKLTVLHPQAKVVCSVVPEIAGNRNIRNINDPHELGDVDVGVIRAQFGIAENGAVWLTEEDLVINALGFLSQHLIILLDPKEIVADMHDAYRRVQLDKTAFGTFMMGPSATGDIEATMVRGAQGARSLNIFFLAPALSRPSGN